MYVSGLKLGLSAADLRTMPFGRLANMLGAWNRAGERADDGVRDATPADIANFAR